MTDLPSGITEFDYFVHTTYIYKLKENVDVKFIIKKSSNYSEIINLGRYQSYKDIFRSTEIYTVLSQ